MGNRFKRNRLKTIKHANNENYKDVRKLMSDQSRYNNTDFSRGLAEKLNDTIVLLNEVIDLLDDDS